MRGSPGRLMGTPALGGARAGLLFDAPLRTSLIQARGVGSPTFTRSTTATFTDWEGVLRPALSGEARFEGARRVRNQIRNNTMQGAVAGSPGTAPTNWIAISSSATGLTRTIVGVGTESGIDYIEVRYTGTATSAGTLQFAPETTTGTPATTDQTWVGSFYVRLVGGAVPGVSTVLIVERDSAGTFLTSSATSVSAPTSADLKTQRRAGSRTLSGGAATAFVNTRYDLAVANGAVVDVTVRIGLPQIENVTGQSNTNPSEAIRTGDTSLAPIYHGAGVDAVKYFDTQNGNTVASGVVTEATGAAISDATIKGYLAEGQRTNLSLWSRDLTNAAWVKSASMAAALTATGADGAANSATTLTASAINQTALQSITSASAARVTGCYIKRRTGSGVVEMTQDNGTTWAAVTVTAAWAAVTIPSATLANPVIGFRIVTSGDAIDVDYVMHEVAVFVSSPIPTTTVAVTRNADVLTYPNAGNVSGTRGTAFAEVTLPVVSGNQYYIDLANTRPPLYSPSGTVRIFDGTTETSGGILVAATTTKIASVWGGTTKTAFKAGVPGAPGSFDGDMNAGTNMTVGAGNGGAANWAFANIKNVKIYNRALSDAEVAAP